MNQQKSDIKSCLDYILNSEREDFEEQCAENGLSIQEALDEPEKLNHVYGFARRAWESL